MTDILPPMPSAAPHHFHSITLIGAAVAGVATFATLAVMLPAPAMFLGWVGYSLGGPNLRDAVPNLVSFLLGLAFGVGTGLAIALLTPALGAAATPVAIAGVVILVLSLRTLAPFNNPLAYFLGLISFFASGMMPSLATFGILAIAGTIGALAAAISDHLQARVPAVSTAA